MDEAEANSMYENVRHVCLRIVAPSLVTV